MSITKTCEHLGTFIFYTLYILNNVAFENVFPHLFSQYDSEIQSQL